MQRNTSSLSHPFPTPLISCLMVTQPGRLDETRQAIRCFSQQLIDPIELNIVHDGNDQYDNELRCLLEEYTDVSINIHQQPGGHSLGWLRNRSLELANANLVCQWDDDDYNHPERLIRQYELMRQEGTDFCFMTDQLHLFTEQRFLFWDDRSSRQAPYDLIENTMLGKRSLISTYPDLARGEDTAILEHLFLEQHKISRLRDRGWLYTYVFNGKNTWDFKHHSKISLNERLGKDELLTREETLRLELKKYTFPFNSLYLPHNEGMIEIDFSD